MNTEAKVMTKALHTVRVVERVAALVVATKYNNGHRRTATGLLQIVCAALGNKEPTDATLYDACVAACHRAIAEVEG